jgi:hypothetical protein
MMAFAFSSLSIQYRRRRAYPWHLHSHLTIQYKRRTAYEEEVYPKQIKLPLNKKRSNGQTIIPLQLH